MADRTPIIMLDPSGGAAGQVPIVDPTGTLVEWGAGGGSPGAATVVVKPANQSQASATLANDTDLSFPIAANESWVCTFIVRATCASATPDIKVAVTAPTGATGATTMSGANTGATSVEGSPRVLVGTALGGAGASFGVVSTATHAGSAIEIRATIINGATAGSVRLQFAQLNLDAANPVTVLAGSYLVAHRVGGGAYGVPTAAEVQFTPTGSIAAADVQTALAELDTEKAPTTHIHAAADVTYAGSTNLAATNVEAALDELDAEKAAAVRPGATVRRSVDYPIPTGTVTTVPWTVEDADTAGFHDLVTNPERLTVPAGYGGLYLITLTAELVGVSSSAERSLLVRKGTGEYLTIDSRVGITTTFVRYAVSAVERLVAGDYITAGVYQSTGASDSWKHAYSGNPADGYTKFSLYRIGD